MRDALAQARTQLGDEAAVLHARQYEEPGLLGLAKKRGVEVLLAVDDDAPVARSEHEPRIGGLGRIESQVVEMRKTLGDLMTGIAVVRGKELSPAIERLVRNGVGESVAESILSGVKDSEILAALARRIRCAGPINCNRRQARVALVGPTGVGKTTTAAKLAAEQALVHKKKVALLTLDTYRVGAVEQLATYARILNVPLEIAMSAGDIPALVEKHADKDLLVIDTVGRSQRKSDHVDELAAFVKQAEPTEVHLVVSASADSVARREAVESFGRIGVDRLIMTKLDECAHPGCILDLAVASLIPYSYVTFGQDVPDDIAVAESDRLAKFVWEGTL